EPPLRAQAPEPEPKGEASSLLLGGPQTVDEPEFGAGSSSGFQGFGRVRPGARSENDPLVRVRQPLVTTVIERRRGAAEQIDRRDFLPDVVEEFLRDDVRLGTTVSAGHGTTE